MEFTIDELMKAHPVADEAPRAQSNFGAKSYSNGNGHDKIDVVKLVKNSGHYLQPHHNRPGGHLVVCFNARQHSTQTTSGDSSTILFEGDGINPPGFKCMHSHCADLNIKDFFAFYGMGKGRTHSNGSYKRVDSSKQDQRRTIEWQARKELPRILPESAHLTPEILAEMLPVGVSPYILDIAKRMQVAIETVAVSFLGAISVVVGRKVAINPKAKDSWLVLLNLWVAIIDRSGRKKTPAMEAAMGPLKTLQLKAQEEYEKGLPRAMANIKMIDAKIKNSMDELKDALKKGEEHKIYGIQADLEKLEKEKQETHYFERRYKTNDCTIEQAAVLMKQNPNGFLMFRDELSGWIQGFDRPGHEHERPFWLEAWCGGEYVSDRVTRGITRVSGLTIAVMGAIQPDKLQALISNSASDGLLQRFQLAVFPEKVNITELHDIEPDTKAREQVEGIFERLDKFEPIKAGAYGLGGVPHFKFSSKENDEGLSAQKIFNSWLLDLELRLNNETIQCPAFESHLSKYRSLMPALALLFELIKWAELNDDSRIVDAVSIESARMAVMWCEFLENHAEKIYAISLDDEIPRAHALAQKIKSGHVPDEEKVRDIYARHHWGLLKTSDEVDSALAVLARCNWIQIENIQTDGRPYDVIRLHPDLMRAKNG